MNLSFLAVYLFSLIELESDFCKRLIIRHVLMMVFQSYT